MKSNFAVSDAQLGQEPQHTQPPCPSSPSARGQNTKQALPADALEALEKRVAAALRQMQQRQEQSMDEAIQLLVGQLWAAYFSIGSLQAHQQQLQAQLQQLMGGALPGGAGAGGGAALLGGDGGGGAGPAEGPEAAGNGDSAGSETVSVTLSDLGDERQEVGCYPHDAELPAAPPPPPRSAQPPRPEAACLSGGSQATEHDHRGRHASHAAHALHAMGGEGCSGGPCQGKACLHPGSRGGGGGGGGGSRKRGADLEWEAALKKERSKRRRLEKEVRELRGLLEALLPHIK